MNNTQVIGILVEFETFLRSHAENDGAEFLRELRERLSKAETTGLSPGDRRNLFGGMGSLADLRLSVANGHRVDDEHRDNMTLNKFRRRLREAIDG
jgi:hypothetical protein